MTTTLQASEARCHGFCCPQRAQCLRYTDRVNHNYSTQFLQKMCKGEGLEHYIPAREQK